MSRVPNKLPLPMATIQAFNRGGNLCKNVGLLFDRYLRFTSSGQGAWEMGKYNRNDTAKEWNLAQIKKVEFDFDAFKPTINRWLETARSQNAEPFRLTPEWRFAVGLGNESAIENGFTFHRLYGFPIIPGSAVKGVARRAALDEIADAFGVPRLGLDEAKKRAEAKEKNRHRQEKYDMPLVKLDELLSAPDEKSEKKAKEVLSKERGMENFNLKAEHRARIDQFREIFGTQSAAGKAIFFDAMPAEAPRLEIDVMNVHYPDYYGKDEYPTDSQNPNPIPFLTVGRTPFWFAVGWREPMDADAHAQAITWLKTGLTEFGIGAKTAAGYGYFEKDRTYAVGS